MPSSGYNQVRRECPARPRRHARSNRGRRNPPRHRRPYPLGHWTSHRRMSSMRHSRGSRRPCARGRSSHRCRRTRMTRRRPLYPVSFPRWSAPWRWRSAGTGSRRISRPGSGVERPRSGSPGGKIRSPAIGSGRGVRKRRALEYARRQEGETNDRKSWEGVFRVLSNKLEKSESEASPTPTGEGGRTDGSGPAGNTGRNGLGASRLPGSGGPWPRGNATFHSLTELYDHGRLLIGRP